MHRLVDLDRRGRLVAGALAALLIGIALVSAAVNVGRWEPQGDDALIELRAWDVGTARTPLVGQPSTSGSYGEGGENVAHPGPAGFVVLAPGVRLLGPVAGTLLSTALVGAASLLAIAWLLFRHLGPRGGAAGVALGALAAFSAGAAGVVDPLSSNFGRLPLLAAAVGVWALLVGDLRVAPLTVAFWSFAAQQHLSVLPAAAPLAVAGAVGIGLAVWQAPADERWPALGWVAGAALVGLVVWSPVLWQEVSNDPGNLTALADYSGDASREDLGLRSAFGQVANALGPRPFLGRSSPRGWDLVAHRSTAGVVATLGIVAAVVAVGAWWQRRDRRFVAAAAMVAILALAGLVTGTNIPDSPEQGRLNFFHWAFALSFFWLLLVGWLGARLAPVVTPKLTHGRAATAAVVAGVVALGVLATPLVVERRSDRLGQPLQAPVVRELLDQLESADALADGGPTVVLVNGDDRYIQIGDTVGARFEIDEGGIVFPDASRGFVHPDRLADRCTVPRALVLTLAFEGDGSVDPPGEQVAAVDAAPDLDRDALARLVDAARGVSVEFGPDLEAALEDLPADQGELVGSTLAFRLPEDPARLLLVRSNLDLLIAHPPVAPALDVDDLRAVRDGLPDGTDAAVATDVRAHLLDRDELEAWAPSFAC